MYNSLHGSQKKVTTHKAGVLGDILFLLSLHLVAAHSLAFFVRDIETNWA